MMDCAKILKDLKSDDNEIVREAAFQSGEHNCVEAVPLLAELLKTNHLGLQEAADHALRHIGGKESVQAVVPLLRSDDVPVRNLSMDILREVGAQDFPSLVELVHDEDTDIRIFAVDILGSTDSFKAVEPLCDALLKDPEVNVRYQAAVSLGELENPDAAKCLNFALNDDEWVQYAVIEALAKIKHASSVEALVKALDRSSDLVASMIIDALSEVGNIKAVTMLLRHLDKSATALRNKIVKAIVNILGGKSLKLLSNAEKEKLREYMLIALKDEDEEVQDAAIMGLGFVGGNMATEQILSLSEALDADHDRDRLGIMIDTLANIGLNESLVNGLNSDSEKISAVAVEVLSRLEGQEVANVLMQAFPDKERDLKRDILAALVRVAGAEAKEFFINVLETEQDGAMLKATLQFLGNELGLEEEGEKIFSLLQHPYDDVKEAALEACVSIGGEEMISRFIEMFSSEDPINRLMAVYALGKLDSDGNLDIIKMALEDEVPDIRKIALESLNICSMDTQDLEIIVSRLNDENRDVRLTVIELMGKCYNEKVVGYIIQALDDDDDWVQVRAAEALGDKKEKAALSKLISLLDAPNKLVVFKVIEALGNIGGTLAFQALLGVSNSSDDSEVVQAAEDSILKIQEEQGDGE